MQETAPTKKMKAHHCQTNHQNLSKQFSGNFIPVTHNSTVIRAIGSSRKLGNKKGHYYPVKCCSSSTSQQSPSPPLSAGEEVELKLHHQLKEQYNNNNGSSRKENFGFLVSDENGWQVRRMADSEDEMRKVASVQAQAFHEPVLLFNDLFFEFFQVHP